MTARQSRSLSQSAGMSYIVQSMIATWTPEPEYAFGAEEWRFAQLPPQFGFEIVTWSPDKPEVVREIHWNTEQNRRASVRDEVGRIVERAATKSERHDGERQHRAHQCALQAQV